MAWGFRRSINFGPLRLNLSKSGVGYSIGTKGFRVGKDAAGRKYRSMSIPYTGIYQRDYLPNKPSVSPPPPPLNTPTPQTLPSANRAIGIRWVLYVGGALVLYALIRAIF